MTTSLEPFGLDPQWVEQFEQLHLERSAMGRVVRQDRGFVLVAIPDDLVLAAVRPRRKSAVVVGDWVAVENEAVEAVLDRRSFLSRQIAREGSEQPIVANVDLVLIVCGADRPLNVRRVERAVTQAWEAKATPVVVVTKVDLFSDDKPLAELRTGIPGVDVLGVSSQADQGLDEVRVRMADRTSVMVGESGAGKSTLVNALLGADIASTGEVRSGDYKGRHTTTRRELHLLPGGGCLIDTPGVRSLGLWADEASVDATFPDIVELSGQCRFANCTHASEPDCAIRAAIAAGHLEEARLNAWLDLSQEASALEIRRTEHERRKNEKKFSKVVDHALRRKGRR